MAIDFITTPGDSSATSYPTLQDATDYLGIRPGGAATWFALDQTSQQNSLIYGTRQLDLMCTYDGTVADRVTPQALGWPRVEAYDCEGILQDNTTVPTDIRYAAVELAYYYHESDRLSTPGVIGTGLTEGKVDVLEGKFDVNMRFDLASRNVEILLGCLGDLKGIAKFSGVGNGQACRA
jgi:hypothetical protein